MSAAHTPGPWQWVDDYTLRPALLNPDQSSTHTILSRDGAYGFVGADPRDVESEFAANRALIEAAPDLLDAANAARRALADLVASGAPLVYRVALAKLDAAIAKAQREQVPA